MNTKTVFFLKVAGLLGLFYSTLNIITITITTLYTSNLTTNNISLKVLFENKSIKYNIIFSIIFIIISGILFFIGKSNEAYIKSNWKSQPSLENQIVGLVLIVLATINLNSVYIIIKNFHQYTKFAQGDVYTLKFYRFQIWINLVPVIFQIIVGIILMLFCYRKRVVYDVNTDQIVKKEPELNQ